MESFEVSLSAEEDPAILFGLSSIVVEIEDNDHVIVGLVEDRYTVAEEGGAVEVCTRLTGAIERVVNVTMTTEGVSATGEYTMHTIITLHTLQHPLIRPSLSPQLGWTLAPLFSFYSSVKVPPTVHKLVPAFLLSMMSFLRRWNRFGYPCLLRKTLPYCLASPLSSWR